MSTEQELFEDRCSPQQSLTSCSLAQIANRTGPHAGYLFASFTLSGNWEHLSFLGYLLLPLFQGKLLRDRKRDSWKMSHVEDAFVAAPADEHISCHKGRERGGLLLH